MEEDPREDMRILRLHIDIMSRTSSTDSQVQQQEDQMVWVTPSKAGAPVSHVFFKSRVKKSLFQVLVVCVDSVDASPPYRYRVPLTSAAIPHQLL